MYFFLGPPPHQDPQLPDRLVPPWHLHYLVSSLTVTNTLVSQKLWMTGTCGHRLSLLCRLLMENHTKESLQSRRIMNNQKTKTWPSLDFIYLSFHVCKRSGDVFLLMISLEYCLNYACCADVGKRHPRSMLDGKKSVWNEHLPWIPEEALIIITVGFLAPIHFGTASEERLNSNKVHTRLQ